MELIEKILCIMAFVVKEMVYAGGIWLCVFVLCGLSGIENQVLWARIVTGVVFLFLVWYYVIRELKKKD